MNGWYDIQPEWRDVNNPNYEPWVFLHFENNVVINSATWRPVRDFWNIDTDEKAVFFIGNYVFGKIANDHFGYENIGKNA